MSYGLEFAEEALAAFRKLESWLQEEALDELELLITHAANSNRYHLTMTIHDFVRERNGLRFYVFLTTVFDPPKHSLRIVSMGAYTRPI